MREQMAGKQQTGTEPLLSPLHSMQAEGRQREPHVEKQGRELLRLPRAEFWRRARIADRTASEWVQEEALVVVLRVWNRQGDADAWNIAQLLVERVAGFITRHTGAWHLPPHHLEQCLEELHSQMLCDLLDTSRSAEFWEVRFWLCLKRRLLNCVQHYRLLSQRELLPVPLEDESGQTEDYFERLAAPSTLTAHQRVEAREALAQLPENERIAFVLYHYEGWGQEQIAEYMQCDSRTVRNRLTRARTYLEAWLTETPH